MSRRTRRNHTPAFKAKVAHGGEVRHHVIRDEMKAKGYRSWQTARRRLTKAGKIKKVAYGRYRLVNPVEAA